MKLVLGVPVMVFVLLDVCGCTTMQPSYNAIYTATCPAVPEPELRGRFRFVVEGVADRLQVPRSSIADRAGMLITWLSWRIAPSEGSSEARGVIIFSEDTPPSANTNELAAVIQTSSDAETAHTRQVRSAIEAELTHAGCTKWDFRYQLKLS